MSARCLSQGLWQKQCEYGQHSKASMLNPEHVACKVIPVIEGICLYRRSTSFPFYRNFCYFVLTSKKQRMVFYLCSETEIFSWCWATITITVAWYKNTCTLFPVENISWTLQDIKWHTKSCWTKNCPNFFGRICFLLEYYTFVPTMDSTPSIFQISPWHHRYIFPYSYYQKEQNQQTERIFYPNCQSSLSLRPLPHIPLCLQVAISSSQTHNANNFVGTRLYLLFRFGVCFLVPLGDIHAVHWLSSFLLSSKFMLCDKRWPEMSGHPWRLEAFTSPQAPCCLELLAVNLTYGVSTLWGRGNHSVCKREASLLAGYGVMDIGPQQKSIPAVRILKFKGKCSFLIMQNLTLKLIDSSWESSVLKTFWIVTE